MDIQTRITAVNNKVTIVNGIDGIDSSIATVLETHFKDKLAKAQKKSPVTLKADLVPSSEKGNFLHTLSISTEKILEPEELIGATAVLEELHKALIEAALIPSHIINILADLKPLKDGEAES